MQPNHSHVPNDKPRVMMVLPKYPYPIVGGLERQAHELAKVLFRKGIEVQVISSKFKNDDKAFELVDEIPVHRIPLSKVKFFRFIQSPLYLFGVLFKLRHTYDVVHLHQFGWFGLFGILITKVLGKPSITKLPNVGERGIPGLQKIKFGRLMQSILLLSDAIVAMSQESVAELKEVNFPMCRVLMTPNGINSNVKVKEQSLNVKPTKVSVVFIGRLTAQKGIDDLLYAWQILRRKCEDVELEIWGEGPLERDMKSLSHQLDIADSVAFRGHVNNVAERLKKMDIFVLPSYIEGNSNAILEAMLAGLPVVATKVGGSLMQVGKEGVSFLFEPKDTERCAALLEQLVMDTDLRKHLGTKMRLRAKESFDIESVANTYLSAYQSLSMRQRHRVAECSNPVVMES